MSDVTKIRKLKAAAFEIAISSKGQLVADAAIIKSMVAEISRLKADLAQAQSEARWWFNWTLGIVITLCAAAGVLLTVLE